MQSLQTPQADEASSGQRPAKKPRGRYVSKACYHCRRRKLKCSGEEPCDRCLKRGSRCFYNADEVPLESPGGRSQDQSPGNGQTRRSGQSVLDTEARIDRIESMLERLTSARHDASLRASPERDLAATYDGTGDYQGDTAFQAPVDAFNTELAAIRLQLGLPEPSSHLNISTSTPNRDLSGASEAWTAETTTKIQVGNRSLPFPSESKYREYIKYFFEDINPCHSCVNKAEFDAQSKRMFSETTAERVDSTFLALNYAIFALAEILVSTSTTSQKQPPGWHWYLTAEALVGNRRSAGRANLTLIQLFIFEALYLMHVDFANASYNVIGQASRLAFQIGLHRQCGAGNNTPYQNQMRQRVFWVLYFTDRRISLSCGRPYGIRDEDVDLQQPAWILDEDLIPTQPLPDPNPDQSSEVYTHCMVRFAQFAGEIWLAMFSARAARPPDEETLVVLDARISDWVERILPTIPLLPRSGPPSTRHLRQEVLVRTRMLHLRLLLRRQTMVSLTFDGRVGRLCGQLATESLQQIQYHSIDATKPSSFRFHMAVTLGSAVLILSTLLCRPLHEIGLGDQRTAYVDAFRQAVALLEQLGQSLQAARRILHDLAKILQVVQTLLDRPSGSAQPEGMIAFPQVQDFDQLFPYGTLDWCMQPCVQNEVVYGAPQNMLGGDPDGMGGFNVQTLNDWSEDMGSFGVPWI